MTSNSPPEARWDSRKRIAAGAGRGVAVALTVLLGVYTLQTLSEFIHGPEPVAQPEPVQLDPAMSFTVAVNEGNWQIAGSPSMLGGESCPAAELDAKLSVVPAGSHGAPIPPELRRVLVLMTAQHTTEPGGTCYRTDSPRYRVRIFTRGSGAEERWTVFRIATPTDADAWIVSELRPATQANTFPLPAGGTFLATRSGSDQKAQAELVSWVGAADDLRNAVVAAGWEAAASSPDGFACKQGDRRAWVWVWPGDGPERMAIVVFATLPLR